MSVLRSEGRRRGALVGAAGLAAFAVLALLVGREPAALVVAVMLLAAAVWFALTSRVYVGTDQEAVVVQNTLRRLELPWHQVRSFALVEQDGLWGARSKRLWLRRRDGADIPLVALGRFVTRGMLYRWGSRNHAAHDFLEECERVLTQQLADH